MRAANVNATVVFSMNCVAVVPLASVIRVSTILLIYIALEFRH